MKEGLEKYQKQHDQNYHDAVIDTIRDNNAILVEEDLIPLFKKPPLDSMDVLKSKILGVAKDTGVILSLEELEHMMEQYRSDMIEHVKEAGTFRKEQIEKKINDIFFKKEKDSFISLSLFQPIKEELQITFGKHLESYMQENMIPSLPYLLDENKNFELQANDLFLSTTSEYLTYRYPEMLLHQLDGRINLKDNILANRLNEHKERYEFTKEHSRILEYASKDQKSNR